MIDFSPALTGWWTGMMVQGLDELPPGPQRSAVGERNDAAALILTHPRERMVRGTDSSKSFNIIVIMVWWHRLRAYVWCHGAPELISRSRSETAWEERPKNTLPCGEHEQWWCRLWCRSLGSVCWSRSCLVFFSLGQNCCWVFSFPR